KEVSDFQHDLAGRTRIAPNSGSAASPAAVLFAYQRNERQGPLGVYRCHFDRAVDDTLGEVEIARVAPLVDGAYDIVEKATAADQQIRRLSIAAAFAPNLSEPSSNLTYLEEAYYF